MDDNVIRFPGSKPGSPTIIQQPVDTYYYTFYSVKGGLPLVLDDVTSVNLITDAKVLFCYMLDGTVEVINIEHFTSWRAKKK